MGRLSIHLVIPFEIDGTRAKTVDEASLDEVTQNVDVIVRTRRGERLMVPEFGIEDPTFRLSQGTPDTGELAAAVALWEPRAVLTFSHAVEGNAVRLSVGVDLEEVDA